MRRSGSLLGSVLIGVPLLLAALGPLLSRLLGTTAPTGTSPLLPPGGDFVLGTDVLGRDVLGLALGGGTSVVGLTVGALALAYVVGVPLGLALAGTVRAWADRAVLAVLDIVLVVPSLLLLLVLAAAGRRGTWWLLAVAALISLPPIVRLVRAAASVPDRRAALETMTMLGEPWWRVRLLEAGRLVAGPVAVDAGSRLVLLVALVTSANFLGLGLAPDAVDWAVMIEQNTTALFLAPVTLLLPAALLVSLCAGANLLVDQALAHRGAS
ncbi:ABC transporter permease subunit [Actinomycetospora sp. OC33-EN08]|uniref:ABC transporter permease subunit n=1 Tax=Actinomycetospora aurantiaca TaxID=3129233 RepID=A0ABU8ML73_9PSEU